jgi:DNA-binding XRE family transcriptional regulator
MTKPQVIFDSAGQPVFAVIPWRDYQKLASDDAQTLLSDEDLFDLAEAANEEALPLETVKRLVAGESPIRVYRDHRGMTQKELAAAANIGALYLSQIETGKRTGSAKTLSAIAEALHVTVDDLI